MALVSFDEGPGLAAALAAVNGSPLPAAIVCNAHITALAVIRSLGRRGVPVVAVDSDPRGYGLASRFVRARVRAPNPLEDEEGFLRVLDGLAAALREPPVLFPCMDEWALAVAAHWDRLRTRFRLPYRVDAIPAVLNKASLYRRAREVGVPIPATVDLREEGAAAAVALGFPWVLKPALKRPFHERFGTGQFQVADGDELAQRLREAADHHLLAQALVPAPQDGFVTYGAYVGSDGRVWGAVVGRRLAVYPPRFGTTCLCETRWDEEAARLGERILAAFGYQGIAECEFLRDPRDGRLRLIDVNTRPWKWIGLAVAAGVDLPYLAYADATGQPAPPAGERARDGRRWVYSFDYARLRAQVDGPGAALTAEEWAAATDAVVDPDDPQPLWAALLDQLAPSRYYCAC